MTPEERDRLTVVETQLTQLSKDVEGLTEEVREMRLTFAKMGGVSLALTAIGALIGYLLTQLRNILGIVS